MTLFRSLASSLAALAVSALPTLAEDLKIVASFSILGDMVKQVAGDTANVNTIVGPDADAHIYQPSVSDARAVAEADVIFVNGLGFETWSQTLIDESGTDAVVFVATDGIIPLQVDGETDPHAWNNLSNGVIYVQNISDALSRVAPDNADKFAANATAYITQLEALDADIRARLSTLASDTRTVVTAHDAFGYLADAYDMTFLAPLGIDTDAEPSARDLATLITQIKTDGAAALFVENITSPALLEQIAAETGLTLGGRLYSDALSSKGGPATGYQSMFDHNMTVLLDALSRYSQTSG